MKTMKNGLRRLVRDQRGKILIMALVALVVGALLLTPLLGLMSTGLMGGQVYEQKMYELYAADAGVEDAIWKLMNPEVSELPHKESGDKPWSEPYTYPKDGDPPFVVNDKNVGVTIQYLGEGVFEITSTADSTTVLSYVHGEYDDGYDVTFPDGSSTDYIGSDLTYYAEGDLTVNGNIEGDATVYVEGDLDVGGNIEGDSVEVYVKGDLTMSDFGNIENTAIVCVGGDLYIGHCSEDGVEVYVEGNLIGIGNNSGIENKAKVCVEGDITVDKIEEGPTVCAGGTLTAEIEGGIIYAEGYSNPFDHCPLCSPSCPECRICCECPLVFGGTATGTWGDWTVTVYLINPEPDGG